MTLEPDPTREYQQTPATYRQQVEDRPVPPTPTGPSGFPVAQTNGFAIASLILGILGITWFPIVPSILAVVFGYKGKREIDRSGGVEQGRGLAVAGIVLGWIAIGLTLLLVLIGILIFAVGAAVSINDVRIGP